MSPSLEHPMVIPMSFSSVNQEWFILRGSVKKEREELGFWSEEGEKEVGHGSLLLVSSTRVRHLLTFIMSITPDRCQEGTITISWDVWLLTRGYNLCHSRCHISPNGTEDPVRITIFLTESLAHGDHHLPSLVFPRGQGMAPRLASSSMVMRLLRLGLAVALLSGFAAILIYITGVSNFYDKSRFSNEDLNALISLKSDFEKCVSANGLGLQARSGRDYCQVTIQFPRDTIPKWRDPKSGELEGLSFDFNLCEAVATWEQVRNSTTILTREFIDALPNGWEEYAWRRINKGILLNRCENKTLCMEKLALVLPERPPFVPRQIGRCAVIGNSGDLLKTRFGKEIDGYDAVIRENGAPIQNYTEYVGRKSTFRLLNRGSAKALDKVVELDETGKEVLIVKTTIHDIMSKMIREIPIHNPVYLMLGASFGSAAKGTGLKALEFALSLCDSVDMYGFTVDPGYKEWTRYFSESRQGHTPLHGRAYYQMMECLGLVKIHSPMRAGPNRVLKWLPSRSTINAARIAAEKLLRRVGAGMDDPLGACSIIKKQHKGKIMKLPGIRKAAKEHQKYVEGATMYPMEHSPGHGMLCTVP
ncbi:Glycosyl transferase [Macleaya cordata]|uniref:Glycosyl transferase n=1 Tax=Macleaya cordata TaxID=56857 RepID=A0A200QGN7_MACCD|nr:Glycosyl transferase [Macleaya cordata]